MIDELIEAIRLPRGLSFYDAMDAAETAIKDREIELDYNGHYPFEKEYLLSEVHFGLYSLKEESLKLLAANQKLTQPESLYLGMKQCPHCAERVKFLFDGEVLKIASICKVPGGIKEVSVELNVPSGKMVFANDLRAHFKVQGDFNINNDIGIMLTMKAYEKVGMVHGFVGNSCPSVFKVNKQTLSISAAPSEDYWDQEKKKWLPRPKAQIKKESPKGKRVGGICTDLWWYCIVDYEDFKTRFLDAGGTEEQFKKELEYCDVINVKPGVYIVQHSFTHRDDALEGKPHHYAHITWSRKPEKRNLYEQYKKLNRTISQCWLSSLANYPTLYGFKEGELPKELTGPERAEKLKTFSSERLEESYRSFLDHTFCTLGAGVDWHENGWGSSNEVPEETPDVSTPSLTKKYHWYPMSREYCSLYLAAYQKSNIFGDKVHLNESFLAAAYEVIRCILTYKVEIRNSLTHESIDKEAHDKELKLAIKEAEEQVVIAQECLQGLAKRYPGSVPEKLKAHLT